MCAYRELIIIFMDITNITDQKEFDNHELVNFGRSVWLDHSRPRSLVVALFSPRFFPVTASSSPSGNCRPQVASHRPQSGVGLGLAPHACPGKEALAQVAD